jgi:teichuronic acid biosynthesis glycosyltransferase TuaC
MKNDISLRDKKLLVISWFPSRDYEDSDCVFVRDQIDLIKDQFREVTVISPVPGVPSYLFGLTPHYRRLKLKKKDYSYDNVRVFFPRHFKLPEVGFLGQGLLDSLTEKAIVKTIEKNNIEFDLIHTHFTWPWGFLGSKLKGRYKKPLIVTLRGIPFRDFANEALEKGGIVRGLESRKPIVAIRNADMVVTPHHEFIEKAKKLGIPGVKYISKHVDSVFFEKAVSKEELRAFKKENGLEGKIVITYLARLDPVKDPMTFIKAMPKVLEKRDDIVFFLVGDGPLRDDVLKAIDDSGVGDKCKVYGHINASKRHLPFMVSDIACIISPLENVWSSTLMEALGAGVATIVTRAGVTENYIGGDKEVIMIEPRNPQELSDAMLRLVEDNALRKRIADTGYAFAKNMWYPERIKVEWIDFYRRLLVEWTCPQ